MSAERARLEFPFAVRVRMWARRGLPLLGFLGTFAGIFLLLHQRLVPGRLIGLATELDVPVSAGVAGRLSSVLVTIHQEVEAGTVVATLDDRDAQLEVEAAVLGLAELRAELEAARERQQVEDAERATDLLQLRRRLELDRLDAKLGQVVEQGLQGRDAAALEGLSAELSRVSELAGDMLAVRRLDAARADHNALSSRIEGRKAVMDEWQLAEQGALARLEALPALADELGDKLLLPFDAAILTAENRLERTRLAVEQRVLRAPVTGRVAAILQRPGEEVVVNEPIVQISAAHTTGIMAWIKEEQLLQAKVAGTIEVRRVSAPAVIGPGRIESLGPAVVEVPFHARRDPTQREFGLPVVLRMPESFALTPGEKVHVQLVP